MTISQDYDLTTAEGVKSLMSSSVSEETWNNNCDKVKEANGGYPSFWYQTVILSGLLCRVKLKWFDA